MAFTLIAADGGAVGDSLVEHDRFDDVRAARARAAERGVPDRAAAGRGGRAGAISLDAERRTVRAAGDPARPRWASTSGPGPSRSSRRSIADAKTVLWNGPMGVFELEPFSAGTRGVATAIADARRVQRGRRRRLPAGREACGLEDGVRSPLDRRRRLVGVPGGPRAARASRSWRRPTVTERRPIIAANWKMHKTHLEAIQAVQKLSYLLDKDDAERVEVVICPPFTALRSVADADRLRPAAVRARRAERLPRGQGRVHRRGVAAHARGTAGRLRDRRALRAPAAVRRGRRAS